ncbi:Transcriptional regulator, Crp/Fnr family [hydrothermal vent metagenome]|uniref:Transcriptional regulator, Crp/Fnr family n=1 Tax=hydrothermal vent metagenome TaxID=652676 RepID=A0A3B0RIY0_9ZZZZ
MVDIAKQLHLFFGLRPDSNASREICSNANIMSLPKGARLFVSGDTCENFIIVASGKARVQLTTRTGRDITLFRLESGQSCALTTSCLLSDSTYYAEGIAETDIDIIAVPQAIFQRYLAKSPELTACLLDDFASRIGGLTSLVDRLTSRDLDMELATLLLGEQNGDGRILLSHRAIADELGTAREVISRKLKELEKANIVHLARGSLHILDTEALKLRVGLTNETQDVQ